tara:strand:- start:923 stop:1279 length:357 start_codon:yes stop_codon:yes gene_type:complete
MPFRNRIISDLNLEKIGQLQFQSYDELFHKPPVIQPITLRKQLAVLSGHLDVDGKSIREIFEYFETCMASKVMRVNVTNLSKNKLAKNILEPFTTMKTEVHFREISKLVSMRSEEETT